MTRNTFPDGDIDQDVHSQDIGAFMQHSILAPSEKEACQTKLFAETLKIRGILKRTKNGGIVSGC